MNDERLPFKIIFSIFLVYHLQLMVAACLQLTQRLGILRL